LSTFFLSTNFTVGIFDKVGFDLDVTGRQREIARIDGRIRADYANRGGRVSIAVWNMHVPVEHDLYNEHSKVIRWDFERMGAGGGFEIVVFRGSAYIHNKGAGGLDNWRCSGNTRPENNSFIHFEPIA
jgi:hypothetical protein